MSCGETISKNSMIRELNEIDDFLHSMGECRKANMVDMAIGFVNRCPDDNFIQEDGFKVGRYYKHTTGEEIAIVGEIVTTLYGRCLVAESNSSCDLKPIGRGLSHMQNWTEISEDEWLKNFNDKEKCEPKINISELKCKTIAENDNKPSHVGEFEVYNIVPNQDVYGIQYNDIRGSVPLGVIYNSDLAHQLVKLINNDIDKK